MFEKIDFEIEFTSDCYFKLFNAFEKGIISENEWAFYCEIYLKDLMFLHKDILKNLKER